MGRTMQELMIFNSFLENTSDSIVIKEYFSNGQNGFTGGAIICASAAKARHYGLNINSIRGQTDFDLMPREQAEKSLQDDLWVMNNRLPMKDIREEITHKNGEIVKVSVTKFPWILPGGQIVGVMCIARDISIRERTKEHIRDFMKFIMRDVLKPLLKIYHTDLKDTKSGYLLKTVIFRLISKLKESKNW
ncbi:MAG: PAS domain S-box protein [Desulfuromonadaceae bacterium]|nr:PAS domain S-box protein [Desulfuromonadaceae bacterium]